MAGFLNSENATTLYPAFLRPNESPPAPLKRLMAFLATIGRFLEDVIMYNIYTEIHIVKFYKEKMK
jgi:hypothetical protein